MKLLHEPRRIVCVLPKGKALSMVKRLREEKGVLAANIHTGRGRSTSVSESTSYGVYAEVEIISLIVEKEQADDLFEFIFFEADINKPHGGFIYLLPLTEATAFSLPDIPLEE